MYGVIDFSRIDTTPGAQSAFAPPAGWQGNGWDYEELMRLRFRHDAGARQHLLIAAMDRRSGMQVAFVGPYAEQARSITEKLARWLGAGS